MVLMYGGGDGRVICHNYFEFHIFSNFRNTCMRVQPYFSSSTAVAVAVVAVVEVEVALVLL